MENNKIKLVEYYFKCNKNSDVFQTISERTIKDIDFYELFAYVNRCLSKIGEQYLFDKLLTIKASTSIDEQEQLIDLFVNNTEKKTQTGKLLSLLKEHESYYISNLIFDDYIKPPKWFWLIRICSFLPTLFLILTFFFSKIFILLLVAYIVNLILHLWNKKNLYIYVDSFSQLLKLCRVVRKLDELNLPIDSVLSSLETVESQKKRLSIFRFENRGDADLLSLILLFLEHIRIFFLLEPLIAFKVLKFIDERRNAIHDLFMYVGKVDSAISVLSLREEAPYFCKPAILEHFGLAFNSIYHPLIPECVPNSLKVGEKSVLLTGSNMSGKTTFIRTVAINTLGMR